MPETLPTWSLVLAGVLLCVAGWGLYRLGLRVVGFILGALVGAMVGFTFGFVTAQFGHADYNVLIIAACAILLGLINAYLFYKVYLVGIFILCSIAGYYVMSLPATAEMLQRFNLPDAGWIPFAVGLLIGAGMLLLHRYVVIVLTSLAGSGLLVLATEQKWLLIPLLAGGILIQLGLLKVFKMTPGIRRRSAKDDEE